MKKIITVVFLFFCFQIFSQETDSITSRPEKISDEAKAEITQPAEQFKYSLRSPHHTVKTHLRFLHPDTYFPDLSAKAFNVNNAEEAKELSVQLKQIFDGKGLYVDLDIIPKESDFTDTATRLNRYILFPLVPEIYVEKVGDKWFYSRQTVQEIPKMHRKIYPFGSDWLINLMPQAGHKKIIGLELWQYLGILLLLLLTFLLHKIFTPIIRAVINQLALRFKLPNSHVYLFHGVAKALSLLLLTLLLAISVPVLQFPPKSAKYLTLLLNALTPFFAMLAAYRAADILSWYLEKRAEVTPSQMDDQLVPLLRKFVKVFVIATGVLIILDTLDFNIMTLLAGLSIGGLAIALAAQDTIKNLFGSLMILIDRPFQIGDAITFDNVTGSIEEVGFRSTRIRTAENSLVYVPNGELANSVIDNKGLRIYRRYRSVLGLTYDTPPALIEKFVEGLREIALNHPKIKNDEIEIHLNEMSSSSLNIVFNIFFRVHTLNEELVARQEVIMATLQLAETLGIRFAFPTQTLHVESLPEKKFTLPAYDINHENISRKISAFVSRYKEGLKKYEEDQPGQNKHRE